jgi:NitT/TauT family transport system ATP-binding protein
MAARSNEIMGKVEIRNITRTFRKEGAPETLALDNVSLDMNDKEFVCFVGPSGCGKTTLLRIIAGLDTPDAGEILLDGAKISIPDSKRGMVFQEYSLFPWRTVTENIIFGPEMKGVPKKKAIQDTEKYLELVGLTQFRDSFPYELSGGMRQRVAIARALANEPEVLLMDEPFGALDAQTRNSLQHQLLDIWDKKHITILFVTHSVDEAVFLADRIVVMTARPGKIKEIINVDLPRPRIRTSPEANKLRTAVLKLLSEERKERID